MLLVCDDEHPNVVTAGAIVTVTVMLKRHDMKTLFGDSTVVESQPIPGDGDNKDDKDASGDAGGGNSIFVLLTCLSGVARVLWPWYGIPNLDPSTRFFRKFLIVKCVLLKFPKI